MLNNISRPYIYNILIFQSKCLLRFKLQKNHEKLFLVSLKKKKKKKVY